MLHREARIRIAVVGLLLGMLGNLLASSALAANSEPSLPTNAAENILRESHQKHDPPNCSQLQTKSGKDDIPPTCSPPSQDRIGLAKVGSCSISSDGDSFLTTYTFRLGNYGSRDLSGLSIRDDLSVVFGDTPFSVLGLSSQQLEVNRNFDGINDQELLRDGNVLAAGNLDARVSLDIQVNAPLARRAFQLVNQAVAKARDQLITDLSFGGLSPDPNGDGDPNEQSPTKVVCETPRPAIIVEKNASEPVLNDLGTHFQSTFSIELSNPGVVPLTSLTLTDDLSETFRNSELAVTVERLRNTSLNPTLLVNPGYGISEFELLQPGQTLQPGERQQLQFEVLLSPIDTENRGPFINTVYASGLALGETLRDQDSAQLKLPDNPETYRLGLAKFGQCQAHADGFRVTYNFTLENFGSGGLQQLQILDDLSSRFGSIDFEVVSVSSPTLEVNPSYNGTSSTNLLSPGNTLPLNETAQVSLQLQLASSAAGAEFLNMAKAITSRSIDFSTPGYDPDPDGNDIPSEQDQTRVVCQSAEITVEKKVTELPLTDYERYEDLVDLEDFPGHLFGVNIVVSNTGQSLLTNVGLEDDLSVTFPADVDYAVIVPPAFNHPSTANSGYGVDQDWQLLTDEISLAQGQSTEINFVIALTPYALPNPGPFTNTVFAVGTTPFGTRVHDDDDDVLEVPTRALIGLAKSGACEYVPANGSYDARFDFVVQNYGATPLNDIQIIDNLTDTFGDHAFRITNVSSSSELLTVDPEFNGLDRQSLILSSTPLPPDERATVSVEINLDPSSSEIRFENRARVSANDALIDASVDGENPDPDGNSIPTESSPTPLVCQPLPSSLELTKRATIVDENEGTVSFDITVTNTGETTLSEWQITDNLRDTFPLPIEIDLIGEPQLSGDATLDDAYFDELPERTNLLTGSDHLAPGAEVIISFTVQLSPQSAFRPGDFTNRATTTAYTPTREQLRDHDEDSVQFVGSPIEKDLGIDVVADKPSVRVGQSVDYTITVTNESPINVPGVNITDTPPPGFRPEFDDTDAYLIRANAPPELITASFQNGVVTFSSVDFGPNESVDIVYTNRVTTAAQLGLHDNLSSAFCDVPNAVRVQDFTSVEVIADPVFDKGTVLGKVFLDIDRNGTQGTTKLGEEEPGIENAHLITPEGLEIHTDQHGRFHIAGIDVDPIFGLNYVVKLDVNSLGYRGQSVPLQSFSDPRQIVPLMPGGVATLSWAVGSVEPVDEDLPVDCCGPYIEGERVIFERGAKKLDVTLRNIRHDPVEPTTPRRTRLEFEISANYGSFAQCAELAVFDADNPRKLLRNRLVTLDQHRQWVNIGLESPPPRISYQLYAFAEDPAQVDAETQDYSINQDAICTSRLLQLDDQPSQEQSGTRVEQKIAIPIDGLDLAEVDTTKRRVVQIPIGDFEDFPSYHPDNSLFHDNVNTYPTLTQVLSRRHETEAGTAYQAGEFIHKSGANWADNIYNWRVSPSHEAELLDPPDESCDPTDGKVNLFCNQVKIGIERLGISRTIRSGQSLEPTDFQKNPPQVGGHSGLAHLDRHPAFVHDHIDFSADGRKARSVCCNLESEIETFFDRLNSTYSAKLQNLNSTPIEFCWFNADLPPPKSQQHFEDLVDECNRSANDQNASNRARTGTLLPGRTVEYYLGNFDPRGPRGQTGTSFVFMKPVGDEVLLGEFIGYRIQGQRPEEDGHWRPPQINQLCGLIDSAPQTTPNTRVGSLHLSNNQAVNSTGPETAEVKVAHDFGVAVVDITAGRYRASGDLQSVAAANDYDDDFIAARIAGFWEGIKPTGKGVLEWVVQADSTKDDLDQLGRNLKRKDAQRLFRQLDPDNYYPTYGDDSTVVDRTNSQSAYFAEVKYGAEGFGELESRLGNFHTDFTGTEFAHFNRSLFGLNNSYQTESETRYGDKKFASKVFASEAQTAVAHAEFEATGGSLYYLKHTDIVMGSEKLWVEVRRRGSLQIEERRVLRAGRDYEIDPLQGRILLRSPLNQVLRDRFNSVIRTDPLNGDDVYLLADYEYLPRDFDSNRHVYGARAKGWIGDQVGVGATYAVDEQGLGENTLAGLDGMYRWGAENYISAEFARTDNQHSSSMAGSFDGGLTFDRERDTAAHHGKADARSVEAYVELKESNGLDGEVRAWWKERERGYNTHRFHTPNNIKDTGLEFNLSFEDRWSRSSSPIEPPTPDTKPDPAPNAWTVSGRLSEFEEQRVSSQRVAEVQVGRKFGCNDAGERCWTLDAAVRYEDNDRATGNDPWVPRRYQNEGEGHYVGVRVAKQVAHDVTVYAALQSGDAERNDYADGEHIAVGVNRRINDDLAMSVEQSYGDRGPATTLGVDYSPGPQSDFNVSSGVGAGATTQIASRYELFDGHELFGTYTMSPDRTEGERNVLSFGQRSDAGRRTQIFTESQFGHEAQQVSTGHAFGIDHKPKDEWILSTMIQASEVEHEDRTYERSAYSLGATYHGEKTRLSTRVELREDESQDYQSRQYVTSNALEWRINDSNRFLGKLNAAFVDDNDSQEDVGRFVELGLGYAHRPITTDRFNLLSRYTYLLDVGTRGQTDTPGDERSHLFAVEGAYNFGSSLDPPSQEKGFRNGNFALGGKLALRAGKERAIKGQGRWAESKLGMAAVRGTYRFNYAHRSKVCPEEDGPRRKFKQCEQRPIPFYNNVELLAEYRVLKDFEGENSRRGALVGIYKHFDSRHANWRLANTIRVGVGYNFSGFDDRLRHKSYKADGFFVDAMVAF